jgi:hypothetical protein
MAMTLIIRAGRIKRFIRNAAGATNQIGAIITKGANVKNAKSTSEAFLPIRVERVFLPLRRSVSISLMLFTSNTAVANEPAAQPPKTLHRVISRV